MNEVLIWDIDGMIVTEEKQNTWRKGSCSLRCLAHISHGQNWGRTKAHVVIPVGECIM
jgi:hypothetical protein